MSSNDAGIKYKIFEENRSIMLNFINRGMKVFEELELDTQKNSLKELSEKVNCESFKVMVLGEFKRGKSTFINALLGEEVLPAYSIPCTAVINEIKWGEEKKAVLYFKNPMPDNLPSTIPQSALEHIRRYRGDTVPPMEIATDKLYDYVVIPDPSKEQAKSIAETPYEKVELFWPVNLCKDHIEIIDSPGLNEDGTRTEIATKYLPKADAILFVLLCDALASESEMRVIDMDVRGLGHEDIFFICNKFDQVRLKEREMLVSHGRKVLGKKTNLGGEGVFFISARNALDGRLENNKVYLDESGILQLETALADFLTNDRGKLKLLQPSRELNYAIKEAREKIIPSQKKLLEQSLEEIEQKYKQIKPKLTDLEVRKAQIVKRIDNHRERLKLDVRRISEQRLREVVNKIPQWVNEIETDKKIGIFSGNLQEQAEGIVNDVVQGLKDRMELEQDTWQKEVLSSLIEERLVDMEQDVGDNVNDFYINLDDVKASMTGALTSDNSTFKEVSGWERLGAVVGSVFVGDIFSAFVGWRFGIKEMAKNIGVQFGLGAGMFLLGVTNPITIIPVLLGASLIQMFIRTKSMDEKIKEKVTQEMVGKLKEEIYPVSEKMADEIYNQTQRFSIGAGTGLEKEIKSVREQVEAVLNDKRAGEQKVKTKKEALIFLEKEISEIDAGLTDLIFTIAGVKA